MRAIDAAGGRVVYAKTEMLPCLAPPPGNERQFTGAVQPARCATAPDFQATETITYRADVGVPVEITTLIEGIVTQHIVVTALTMP